MRADHRAWATRRPVDPLSMGADHRAVGLLGQHLEQHRVGHAAVDDVHGVDAVLRGIERGGDLGQHAAADGAVGEQVVDLSRAQVGQQLAGLVEHAGDVGQHDQLLGLHPTFPQPHKYRDEQNP